MEWNANLNFFRNPLLDLCKGYYRFAFKKIWFTINFLSHYFLKKKYGSEFSAQMIQSNYHFSDNYTRAMSRTKFLLVIMLIAFFSQDNLQAQVSGYVFRDFNANGVKENTTSYNEPFVANVTVTAFDSTGAAVGTMQTNSSGAYNFTGLNLPLRIEFTDFDSTDYPAAFGAGNGSNVQFYTVSSSNANFGINYPSNYCQSSPEVATNIFYNGLSSSNISNAGIEFDYSNVGIPIDLGGSAPNPDLIANFEQIGSVWGNTYQRTKKRVFFTAFTKRHSGFGPLNEGGVYVSDISNPGSPVVTSFNLQGLVPSNGGAAIDLGNVQRTGGSNYELGATNAPNIDYDAFDKVGKTSFGDAEISEDGKTLWVANLFQTAIISVDVSGATLPGTVNQYVLTGLPSCTNGVFRIFGLKNYKGALYVGGVCTGENGGGPNGVDQTAFVLKYDPLNIAGGYSIALTFPLDYAREGVGGNGPGEWQPWTSTWNPIFLFQNFKNPEPILSNIEFGPNDDMILTFIDRHAHMVGYNNYPRILDYSGTDLEEGLACGDIVKACFVSGAYVIEGSSSCPTNDPAPFGGQENMDGPSNNGEFFWGDYFTDDGTSVGHDEVSIGSAIVYPGTDQVINVAYDPIGPDGFQTQGVQRYNSLTGAQIDGYRLVANNGVNTFGKAAGLGDLELLCNAAPIEIGNRVWFDSDKDGIQDPNESPIAGVTVQLIKDGNVIATAVTDSFGNYYFSNATATSTNSAIYNISQLTEGMTYIVRIPDSNGAGQQTSLSGLELTIVDADNGVLNTLEDVRDSDGQIVGVNAEYTVMTNLAGQNNHNIDFGFFKAEYFDIALKKTLSTSTPGPFYPGSTVTFDVVIYNQGTIDANYVNVVEYVPPGLTYLSGSWAAISGQPLSTYPPIYNLAAGDSIVRPVTFTINSNFSGISIRNWAEIQDATNLLGVPDIDSDPDATNFNQPGETNDLNDDNVINQNGMTGGDEDDHDPAEIAVVQTFDLALKKVLSSTTSGPFTPGSTVSYDITIYNQGTIDASNVNITDYVPNGMTLVNPGTTWTAVSSGKTSLVTPISTLPKGDSVIRTITFTINTGFQDTVIRNWSEISSAANALGLSDIDSDPDTTNFNQVGETDDLLDDNIINQNGMTGGDEDDHDPAEIAVVQTFDLALTKTLDPTSVGPFNTGDTVKFKIEIFNQGTLDATNVNITDYIPNGMILSSPGIIWTNPISNSTTLVTAIPSITAGTSAVITIDLIVSDTFQGTSLRNWSEISSATNALGLSDVDSNPDGTNFNQSGE